MTGALPHRSARASAHRPSSRAHGRRPDRASGARPSRRSQIAQCGHAGRVAGPDCSLWERSSRRTGTQTCSVSRRRCARERGSALVSLREEQQNHAWLSYTKPSLIGAFSTWPASRSERSCGCHHPRRRLPSDGGLAPLSPHWLCFHDATDRKVHPVACMSLSSLVSLLS